MNEEQKRQAVEMHQRTREFLAEIGSITWAWSVIEETLDKSIEKISGLDRSTLKAFLPTANVRRKFEIFHALLKEITYTDALRKEARKHSDWLLKLQDRRSDFVHKYWLVMSIDGKGEVFGGWLNDQPGQERIQKTYIDELNELYREMHKAWIGFLKFLQENGLYT